MAAIPWPSTLPDCPQTWAENDVDNRLATTVESGPPKMRRRFSRTERAVQLSWTLPSEHYKTIVDFYEQALRSGVETFTFKHPLTGLVQEYYFAVPPSFEVISKTIFSVQCSWVCIDA